jgi:hypothetical protein
MNLSHGSAGALALLAVLFTGIAGAQFDQAISDASLREPWDLQKAVVLSLTDNVASDAGHFATATAALDRLDAGLVRFESQIDVVLNRLVGDPQFAYVAAEVSFEMSVTLGDVREQFATLYSAFAVNERADVQAAQVALDSLQSILQQKIHFERDVHRALGSGSRHEILALAGRWWAGAERAIALRKALGDLRHRLAARN